MATFFKFAKDIQKGYPITVDLDRVAAFRDGDCKTDSEDAGRAALGLMLDGGYCIGVIDSKERIDAAKKYLIVGCSVPELEYAEFVRSHDQAREAERVTAHS